MSLITQRISDKTIKLDSSVTNISRLLPNSTLIFTAEKIHLCTKKPSQSFLSHKLKISDNRLSDINLQSAIALLNFCIKTFRKGYDGNFLRTASASQTNCKTFSRNHLTKL